MVSPVISSSVCTTFYSVLLEKKQDLGPGTIWSRQIRLSIDPWVHLGSNDTDW